MNKSVCYFLAKFAKDPFDSLSLRRIHKDIHFISALQLFTANYWLKIDSPEPKEISTKKPVISDGF